MSVEDSDDDGNDEQEQDKKTQTTGRPVKKRGKQPHLNKTRKRSKNCLLNPNALEKVKKLLLNSNMVKNHSLIKRKGQPFQWRKL